MGKYLIGVTWVEKKEKGERGSGIHFSPKAKNTLQHPECTGRQGLSPIGCFTRASGVFTNTTGRVHLSLAEELPLQNSSVHMLLKTSYLSNYCQTIVYWFIGCLPASASPAYQQHPNGQNMGQVTFPHMFNFPGRRAGLLENIYFMD